MLIDVILKALNCILTLACAVIWFIHGEYWLGMLWIASSICWIINASIDLKGMEKKDEDKI